ncbi:MAG: mechanosensitive ion channel family protein [Candidatus Limnocylindrales bacterium]
MPSPTPNLLQLNVHLPTGNDWAIDVGALAQAVGAVLAILVVAAILIRLAHVFVRGVAGALLKRENVEGTATELTAAEIKKRQDTVETLAVNVIRSFVVAIAGLMILEAAFKVDIGPAIAGLGIAGIAIGLGTQHLVRDYLNGALILIENQYGKGDVVRIAGVTGKVEDFTLRRTTLRDSDGTVHTVPNGEVTVASNFTRVFALVNQDVQVAYDTDIDQAIAVVDRVGRGLASDEDFGPRILEAPHVDQVSALGELGVTLRIIGKVRASEQWAVAGELRKRVLAAFLASGVEIPQPQRAIITQSPVRNGTPPPDKAGDADASAQGGATSEPGVSAEPGGSTAGRTTDADPDGGLGSRA